MGGNPPIKKHSIVDKIVLSSKIERIVIFTVFRDNWQPYMKRYTEVFQSQFPNLNTDYLLLDTEQIDFDSYLDADLIIIGGGNTEKYIAFSFFSYPIISLFKIKNCNLLVAVKHRFTSVPFRNLYFHFQA